MDFFVGFAVIGLLKKLICSEPALFQTAEIRNRHGRRVDVEAPDLAAPVFCRVDSPDRSFQETDAGLRLFARLEQDPFVPLFFEDPDFSPYFIERQPFSGQREVPPAKTAIETVIDAKI